MLDRQRIAEQLRQLAERVESSTDEELLALEAIGFLVFQQKAAPKASVARLTAGATPKGEELALATLEKLRAAHSRDEARAVLGGRAVTNDVLKGIAKSLGVAVQRADRKDQIVARIVEFQIGSELSSRAINPAHLSQSQSPS